MHIHRSHTFAITVIATAVIAIAASAAPAHAALCNTSSSFPYLCRGDHSYGDSTFGAGYELRTGLATKRHYMALYESLGVPAPLMPDDYVWSGAALSSDATLFGKHRDLVEAELSGTNASGAASARLFARIMGTTVYDQRFSSVTIAIPIFGVGFSASKDFQWGVVSAEVEAQALVGLSFLLTVSGGSGGLSVTGTPKLAATVGLSADVDLGCSASFDGLLTLLSIRTPVTATLGLAQLANRRLDFAIGADLELDAIEGEVDANVDCYFDEWGVELFDYPGFHLGPYSLFDAAATITM